MTKGGKAMFGYVRTDTPYLYMKDMDLYRAMYCGVCKGIGASSGTLCRMGLSYDVTFLSVLLHNILALDVKIEKQHCLTHCIRVKNMAEVDELTKQLFLFYLTPNRTIRKYSFTNHKKFLIKLLQREPTDREICRFDVFIRNV